MKVYYRSEYTASGFSFDTTRKAKWIADSLVTRPIPGVELAVPAPIVESDVTEVHSPDYVAAIRTGQPADLAATPDLDWDPGLWPMALASNGGVVAAALAAMREGVGGSLSSGMHHARRDRGAGYCTFNGLVLAARAAEHAGARSILILDLDAHCGGGTHSLIARDPAVRQVDVSVAAFDYYVPEGLNTLDIVRQASEYLPTIERRLGTLGGQPFDLCLYNAGMDPSQFCEEGGLAGVTNETLRAREELVFGWCARRALPVAFALAGGYTGERLSKDLLVGQHRLTLEAAARRR